TQLKKLARYNLPVSSSTAKNAVTFLTNFYHLNEMDLEYLYAVDHLGWTSKKHDTFIATHNETHGYYLDLAGNLKATAENFESRGTIEKWIEGIKPYMRFPIARAVIASYFASPLLSLVGLRSFIIHTYCNTGGGKTA